MPKALLMGNQAFAYAALEAGVNVVAGYPGPISSQTEQDTRRFAKFAKIHVLDPATPDQGYDMMHEAFEFSERYGTPVILRATTRVSHASTFFDVPEQTVARPLPEGGFERDSKWVIFPKRAYEAHSHLAPRRSRLDAHLRRDRRHAGLPRTGRPDRCCREKQHRLHAARQGSRAGHAATQREETQRVFDERYQ